MGVKFVDRGTFSRCREHRKSITIAYDREGKPEFDRDGCDRGRCILPRFRDSRVAFVLRMFYRIPSISLPELFIYFFFFFLLIFFFFSLLPLSPLLLSAHPGTRQCALLAFLESVRMRVWCIVSFPSRGEEIKNKKDGNENRGRVRVQGGGGGS